MSKLTPTFIYQQKKFKLKEFTKSQEKFLQVQNTAMASGQHEFSANNQWGGDPMSFCSNKKNPKGMGTLSLQEKVKEGTRIVSCR